MPNTGVQMRTLQQSRIADIRDQEVIESLRELLPAPQSPVQAIQARDLRLPSDITKDAILHAVRIFNPKSAPRPVKMSPRLLRLLANTTMSR